MKREDKSARWRVLSPGAGHAAGKEGLKSEMLGKPGACPEPSGALWTCSTGKGRAVAKATLGGSVLELRSPRWRELLRRQKRRVLLQPSQVSPQNDGKRSQ